ncbi:MAG: cellulose binding domain-containing protein [Deltaproteobacteria bacterium]|nr:cellulose binding domain-containing protein [Deltaproteobacteria bacterium]
MSTFSLSARLLLMPLILSGCTASEEMIAAQSVQCAVGADGVCRADQVELRFRKNTDWGTGFCAGVTVVNHGDSSISPWSLEFDLDCQVKLTSLWNGRHTRNGRTVHVDATWNKQLPARGGTIDVGFCAQGKFAGWSGARFIPGGGSGGAPTPCSGTPDGQNTADAGPSRPDASPDPKPDAGPNPGTGSGAKRIIGYFTAWSVYGRNYHVADIPASRLTHINYAFANIANGECVLGDAYADTDKFYPGDTWDAGALRGSFGQLKKLKGANPHLKTLISVGGWTWSSGFSEAALTAANRDRFSQSCVAFMKRYGFDGIDIDWEYPGGGGLATGRPEDKRNFTLLLESLRKKLNEEGQRDGRQYLLTIAAPSGPNMIANIELGNIQRSLNWINIMTYDFHGGWESVTNFNSPLYASSSDPSPESIRTSFNTEAAVRAYLAGGVPTDKIVIGVPFYGRGWQGVPNINSGLYQRASGLPQGTWEAGVFDYEDIKLNYLSRYTRYFHQEAKVPWLYNPATGIMISYDDPESLGIKAQYVRDKRLGGVMFWELSGDDAEASLLRTLHRTLNQ